MMAVKKCNGVKLLKALLGDLTTIDTTLAIAGVVIDSRQVQPGYLFMAYQGTEANGVDYIDDAVKAGAIAILLDATAEIAVDAIPVVAVKIHNLRQQAGLVASRFYGEPSKSINVIGVTGTNGKTTVSYMISYVLSVLGRQTALLGTLGYGQFGKLKSAMTTTPDPVTLHALFGLWKQDSINTVAMEVSSHALEQGRITGTSFNTAVLTNLSRDHLDYHATFEEYKTAKFKLFESAGLQYAIVNIDDPSSSQLIDRLPKGLEIIAYSASKKQFVAKKESVLFVYSKDLKREQLVTTFTIASPWGEYEIKTDLLGQFNIENILAAYAALCVSGVSAEKAALALSEFKGVPGRMECFSAENKPLLVVDYAHTPDALEKALLALRGYCVGRLYCVFGCGGDRDVGKRAQMGEIAERLSAHIVLTNDNPRSEDPEKIIKDILEGIEDKTQVVIKHERADAIINTFLNANKNDVILIAGKGHEATQEIDNMILPFSDRELVRRLIEGNA